MLTTLTEPVTTFLKQSTIPHFIAGDWSKGSATSGMDVMNPSDGQRVATVPLGTAADVEAAVVAGETAFKSWSTMKPVERSVLLHRLADALAKHTKDLAAIESLDVGKAVAAAEGFDVPFGIDCVRYYADLAASATYDVPLALKNMDARIHRAPLGVCGFIFPWNFPFTLLMWGTMPALAAGNTIVVKPSEVTPLSSLYFAKIAQSILPPGVFNVVVGDGPGVGAALSSHPRIKHLSFTGSPQAGKRVAEACARNLVPTKLELGGKGAAVVFDDVDVGATATALAGAITLNTGQVCCTATRWLVHERIYDSFLTKVRDALNNLKIGPGLDPTTQMGPLASATHFERVKEHLGRGVAGGATTLLEGGPVTIAGFEQGYYVKPSLLSGTDDNVCCREEVFGPSAFLMKFNDERQAVDRVNALTYGLANSVWSGDLTRANRVAEQMVAGNSWINAHNVFAYGLPYGGVNLSGMGGGVNSPETYYDYLRAQTIARPL